MAGQSLTFAIPGDLATPTGGYAYDRHLITELRTRGWTLTHLELGGSFPSPDPSDLSHAASALQTTDASGPLLIDGLAFGALDPDTVAGIHVPIVALVHHPLAEEGDKDLRATTRLFRTERDNLAHAAAVIVTSRQTAALLSDSYGVPKERITVAEPGTDQPSRTREPLEPPLILAVGSHSPRKGHDILLRALAGLTDLEWQAVIAGAVGDDGYSTGLGRLIDELSLSDRVSLFGPRSDDELTELYCQASVFALATRYEGYGMVFAEAMAYGLPIVSCDTGAVSDTVATGAGLLVPVDDVDSFSRALRQVLTDPVVSRTLGRASAEAGAALPSWEDTASLVEGVLEKVARRDGQAGS